MKALEKELYDGGDVDSSGSGIVCRRRGIIKFAFGLGLAAAGVKVGGDYLGRVVFPKYEKKKVEPVDPEVEARRKLATENFKYLAERIGGDGAWMIKELSEQYLVKPSLDELSKDYIDQNFRRYDKGPVIVGTEEFYRGVRSALDLAKEKIPEDYEDTMRLVKIIESEIELPSAARGGIWLGKYGSIVLDEEKMKTYTIPALASVISCHEKNHIKYPKYTEQQVRELDPECQKKLGIR